MGKAKLTLSTQGVRGGNLSDYKSIGWLCVAINDEGGWRNNRIDIDAFKGLGETYVHREVPEIRVWNDAKIIFQGTYQEMCDCLKFGKEVRDFGKEKIK